MTARKAKTSTRSRPLCLAYIRMSSTKRDTVNR